METKLPPQNLEAEKIVLSQLILNNDYFYDSNLTEDDFYDDFHRNIFSAIEKLIKQNKKVDLSAIKNETKSNYKDLLEITKFIGSFKNNLEFLKECSIKRKIIQASDNLNKLIDTDKSVEEILTNAQNSIMKINQKETEDSSAKATIRELIEAQNEFAEKYEKGEKYIGYPCGIEKIDDCIDGLRAKHVWVVGAYTSTGKTQFVLNIVSNLLKQDLPVSFISLEMGKADLAARLIGIRLNISSMKVLKGIVDNELRNDIDKEKDLIFNSKLRVSTTFFDIEKIKILIRKEFYKYGMKIFVIDYVQNVLTDKGLREYDLLTKSATDIQALARELGITIIIVSQISAEAEKGQAAGAGFKGTTALESVSDIAIRLKRDRKNEAVDVDSVPVEIVIFKNRHGFTGSIKYMMNLKSGLFTNNYLENIGF